MHKSHIPYLQTITQFFEIYGLGAPLYPEIMCMRLEDQPDTKLMHMPLSRVNFFRVLLFKNANLNFYKAGESVQTVENCLCFSYPGKLESWTRSGKLFGYVVYFTAAFAEVDPTTKTFDLDYPYFNFDADQMVVLSPHETNQLSFCMEEMIQEIYGDAEDKLQIIRKLLHVYLHKVKRIYNAKVSLVSSDLKASKELFNKFRKAIDIHLQQLSDNKQKHHPTVSELALELSVSANYLNGVIKDLTGKTASTHIQEKMLLEAKSFLIHTNLQVAEIAHRLGYENSAYFNRFFKKLAGITPLEFRKKIALR